MKDEHIWSKKPETILDWFCVVGACIAFYLILNNLGYFLSKIGFFIGILSPFAGGVVIAYILDPMVKFFYHKLFKEKNKTRGIAILMAYAVAILLIVLLAWLVIPQIVNSIVMLFTNFPSYIQGVQELLVMMQDRYGIDLQQAIKMLDDSEAMVKEVYSLATAAMPQIVDSIGSVASNFVGIFTSVAASIYMLADKEHLLHQLRTLTHAFLPEKAADNTLRICHYAHQCVYRHHEHHPGVRPLHRRNSQHLYPAAGRPHPGGYFRCAHPCHPAAGRQLHRPEDLRLVHRYFCPVDFVLHRGGRRFVRHRRYGRRCAGVRHALRLGPGVCALHAG